MTADEKISPEFRERLDALEDDETMCVLVTLAPPELAGTSRRKRRHRKRIIAEVDVYTTSTLDELRSLIDESGGEILGVSRPLSIITLQAGRSLIEKLADSDQVAAIIENQPIRGIDSEYGGRR